MPMRAERFSLKHLVVLVLGGLGLIPLLLLLAAYRAATDIAAETTGRSLARVVEVAAGEVVRDLDRRAQDVAYALAARTELLQALGAGDRPAVEAALDDPLAKGFAGVQMLELVKLRAYGIDHAAFAESRLGPDLPPGPPPVSSADGAGADPVNRVKAVTGLWQNGRMVLYSVLVPVGGLRPIGYLELVIDPLFNLARVGEMVNLPLRVQHPDGSIRFASDDTGPVGEILAITHEIIDATGRPAYRLVVLEDVSVMHNRFDNHRLAIGLALVALVGMVVGGAYWAMHRFVIRPITALSLHMAGCEETALCRPAEPHCLREIGALSRAFCTMTDKVRQHTQALEQLSTTDALTGIPNRRRFDDALHHEWQRALRQGTPLSVLLVDVDHFKRYNDLLGHPAGDACLRRIAETLAALARRPSDLVARYGGEEFAVLLPETPTEGAETVATNAVAAIRELLLHHPGSPTSEVVTVTIGGATLVPAPQLTSHRLVAQADEMLYLAKEAGRNRSLHIAADAAPAEPEALSGKA